MLMPKKGNLSVWITDLVATDVRRDSLNRLIKVFQNVSLKNRASHKRLILRGVPA